MDQASQNHDFAINWFRDASPYINAHRGKTLVICLPDDLMESELLATLVHDFTLLNHLGLRLIVSFGMRTQVEFRLKHKDSESTVIDGRRVTNDVALHEIVGAAGRARIDLEARLSMGLPNTPMAGAHLSTCSGNFISAQPFGIHNGVDYLHTGTVRQVHTKELNDQLNNGELVLLPPLGYSLTGDIFNLTAEEIASATATAMQADKLIFFVAALPLDKNGIPLREASASKMRSLIATQQDPNLQRTLGRAVDACQSGVDRVHLLDMNYPNALLSELFTRDGSGTLLTAERWDNLHQATINDVNGIIKLIAPLQENGTLAARSREQLELEIEQFVVIEREGMVIACAALFIDALGDGIGEIACVVTHPGYRGHGRAAVLIEHLEEKALKLGVSELFLLTTRTAHWFIELGYKESHYDQLPSNRQDSYNRQRASKVFSKKL